MGLLHQSYQKGMSAGFKITGHLPIDIRQVVNSSADLTDALTWKDTSPYRGLLVAALSENTVYMAKDDAGTQWVKVSGTDLTEVYKQINEVSAYVSNVSIDVSNLKFTVSNISTFIDNVSIDVSNLKTQITNVSNTIDNVSLRLSQLGSAFIYKGKGYYNSSVTPTSDNYIVDVSGSTTVIAGLRAGDVYQTFDNKEWVYVDTSTHEGEKWVELGLPFKFKHYIDGSTHSEFVNVSTLSEDDAHTIVIVDISKSTLDSSNFEATGFVTDAQLKTALSWVVLD